MCAHKAEKNMAKKYIAAMPSAYIFSLLMLGQIVLHLSGRQLTWLYQIPGSILEAYIRYTTCITFRGLILQILALIAY
jgi:hypothetical protein